VLTLTPSGLETAPPYSGGDSYLNPKRIASLTLNFEAAVFAPFGTREVQPFTYPFFPSPNPEGVRGREEGGVASLGLPENRNRRKNAASKKVDLIVNLFTLSAFLSAFATFPFKNSKKQKIMGQPIG
jgi:hypothetical protein